VLEKRPYLGGRAFSFVDRETQIEVDNGQHVFLGACTEYIAFLKEIGAWGNVVLQDRLDIPVMRNGKLSRLRWSTRVPGAIGLLPALISYRHLGLLDRVRVAYGMTRIRGVRRGRHSATLDRETFDRWLRRHGQNARTIGALWNLIVLPALNDDITSVSADAGVMLFQTALMGGREAAAIGYSRVALSKLAGDAATVYLSGHGGSVRTSVEVERVEVMDGRAVAVVTTANERVPADAVVLAVSHGAVASVVPRELSGQDGGGPGQNLDSAPIVGVHIWYDRKIIDDVFVAVLDSPVQWVFNVDAMHALQAVGTQHVVISLSGAWQWAQMTRDELRSVFVPEMARLFPQASPSAVVRFLSVKQTSATFRCTPGSAALRPKHHTTVPNLALAGDWTDTGWPSTMESAVRSGTLAAEAIGPAGPRRAPTPNMATIASATA
jgi:squalene-associated FAD-dependent desaturase